MPCMHNAHRLSSVGIHQAYWLCWYHGLLLSALLLRLLYELVRRKIHPYPSLEELRAHRSRIDRAHTFGTVLSTRLLASPALGVRDMWGIFRDYRHTRKAKKAAKEKVGRHASDPGLDDSASIHSDATENPDSSHENPLEDVAEEDLKRLGLFLLNEVADVLERLKKYVAKPWSP